MPVSGELPKSGEAEPRSSLDVCVPCGMLSSSRTGAVQVLAIIASLYECLRMIPFRLALDNKSLIKIKRKVNKGVPFLDVLGDPSDANRGRW